MNKDSIAQTVLNFKIARSSEEITSHSGLALVGECFQKVVGREAIRKYLPPRGSNRGHHPEEFIDPVVLMLCGGADTLEGIRQIATDKALRKVLGLKRVPSSDALGSWLKRLGGVGLKGLDKLNRLIVNQIILKDEAEEYTLDIDATPIESEKEEAKVTYKGFKGYMPLLGYLAELDICLLDEFREGNVSPGQSNREFLEACLKVMPARKRIAHFRADSAAYQASVINLCHKKGIIFTITADQDVAVKETIRYIPADNWKILKDAEGKDTDREYAETVHCMNKTDKAFRLIVQRWQNKQMNLFEPDKYFYQVIASNSPEEPEVVIWFHNGKGKSENYHKEIKLGFGLDHIPCGEFMANAAFFRLGIIAYNLMVLFKRWLLAGEWIKKTVATIRWQIIQVAGKLVNHSRALTLKLCSISDETFNLFISVRKNCFALDSS